MVASASPAQPLTPEVSQVLDALPRAIIVRAPDGTVLAWNDVAEALLGWSKAQAIGRQLTELLVSPSDRAHAGDIVSLAEAGGRWSGEFNICRADGDLVRINAHVAPLRDTEGHVVATVCAVEDITKLRATEQRASELADQLTLALAAGELGTWRWDIESGTTRWDETMARLSGVDLATFDGTFDAWVATLHPADRDRSLQMVERALEQRGAYELEHRVVLEDGSSRWLFCRGKVTTSSDGTPTGTIGCASDITERKQAELRFAARAEAAERGAAEDRLARERLEYLSRINDVALTANSPADLMRSVTRAAVPQLGDWCTITFVGEAHTPPQTEAAHSDPAKVEWVKELQAKYPFDPDAPRGVAAVIRTGQPEVIDVDAAYIDTAVRATTTIPEHEARAIASALDLTSVITVPLVAQRGVVGAMQFVSAESGRRYTNDDLALAQAAAGRIAAALDNAWLAQQYRDVATDLQRALLPVDIPIIDGIDVAVRYWAAGLVNEIGGDFYDLFETSPGTFSLVLGDVCGTGPQAAAVTAKARHTIRAAARHGTTPTEVIEWVNDAIIASHRDRFCTLLYAELSHVPAHGWTITTVSSGHPLPVHVRADGHTQTLGRHGTLAGVLPHLTVHAVTTVLEPGDTVVLYTDGVTDVRPPHDISDDELRNIITEAATRPSAEATIEAIKDEINRVLPLDRRTDDMAILVLHVDDQGIDSTT